MTGNVDSDIPLSCPAGIASGQNAIALPQYYIITNIYFIMLLSTPQVVWSLMLLLNSSVHAQQTVGGQCASPKLHFDY